MSSGAIVLSVVVLVVVIGLLIWRWQMHAERQRHAAKVEKMAELADAAHEGARTRHTGGA